MIKHQSIKKVFLASVFVAFFLFIFGSGVSGPYKDSAKTDVEVNDSAIVYCKYCDPHEYVLPVDGFDDAVMGEHWYEYPPKSGIWLVSSEWFVYCGFSTEKCEGGEKYCHHTGEDWNLKFRPDHIPNGDLGAPVYAIANGRVEKIHDDTVGSKNKITFGYQILIKHYDSLIGSEKNIWSQYSHLQHLPNEEFPGVIEEGKPIYRGQRIGTIGKTGNQDAAHLHLETRIQPIDIDEWPIERGDFPYLCPDRKEYLINMGYREPSTVILYRNYFFRSNQVTPLMEAYQVSDLIDKQYNRYFMEKRAYYISFLIKTLEFTYGPPFPEAEDPYFTDIDNLDEDFQSAIRKGLELGIISRVKSKLFRPLDPIQRIEALAFIVRAYEKLLLGENEEIEIQNEPYFDDIQIVAPDNDRWWWIWATAQKGRKVPLVSGYVVDENRYMCPFRWTTREEAVILVNNLYTHLCNESVPVINWFRINNGSPSATSWEVTLDNDVSGAGPETVYKASENPDFEDAEWLPYSSAPTFSINPVDGVKTIYFKVRNGSNVESEVAVDSIIIVLNNDAPIITRFEIENGVEQTTDRRVKLNNDVVGEAFEYMASLNSQFKGAEWLKYDQEPTFMIELGFGVNRIYFKVRNSAGVESEVVSDSITISQNYTPFKTRLKINNGAEVTNNLTVRLNNTFTRNPDDYMASENADFEGAEWLPYVHRPYFTLNEENGVKEVFFRVRKGDLMTPTVSDTIVLERDETLSVTSFTIENGAESTKNREVTIKCKTTGSPTHYKISEYSNFKKSGWKPYKKEEFTYKLSKKKEVKTLYFKVKKKKVESDPVSASITLN